MSSIFGVAGGEVGPVLWRGKARRRHEEDLGYVVDNCLDHDDDRCVWFGFAKKSCALVLHFGSGKESKINSVSAYGKMCVCACVRLGNCEMVNELRVPVFDERQSLFYFLSSEKFSCSISRAQLRIN